MEQKELTLEVFVYGTLRPGHGNHRVANGAPDKVEAAEVVGQIYAGARGGIPFLEIPEQAELFTGTADRRGDAEFCANFSSGRFVEDTLWDFATPFGEWCIVQGNILTYKFERILPALRSLDRLEGFDPGGGYRNFYTRVLTRTREGRPIWLYTCKPHASGNHKCGEPGKTISWPECTEQLEGRLHYL